MNLTSPILKGAAHAAELPGDSVTHFLKVVGDRFGLFADDSPDGSLGMLMSGLAGIATALAVAIVLTVYFRSRYRTGREAYQATGKPVLVMSYWNPIDRYGAERFSSELAQAGGAGCILPDLPVQESARWRESAARHSPATVFIAAPNTTDERLRELTAAGTGFVYASSLMGVTGVREAVSTAASSLVRRIRATTDLPVCVGIGISDAAQAAQVAGFADGVIVGSAFVRRLLDDQGVPAIRDLTTELAAAVRRPAP